MNPFADTPTCDEYLDIWFLDEYRGAGTARIAEADLYLTQKTWEKDKPMKFAQSVEEVRFNKSGKAIAQCVRVLRDRDQILAYMLGLDMREFAFISTNGTLQVGRTEITAALVAGGWQDRSLF